MSWTTLKFFASATGILIIILGLYDIFIKMEDNACDMTYMFDWPRYINVPIGQRLKRKYPKYSLVVYGEGEYADTLQSLELYGIPVVFIPGNAGSPEQGRSLSSVALRKTEYLSFHFNYFFVGFSDEMSAMKGSYLQRQTEFVHECLHIILNLYKTKGIGQDSVLVVAHSMGGIVARGLFTLPGFNPQIVSTMITLATPNVQPVFMFDSEMRAFYANVNDFWKDQSHRDISESVFKDLAFASIGGGNRDFQVRSDLTSMKNLGIPNQTITTITTAMPKVWVSAEHRCIVWCKQLVLAITRAFMDMVDVHHNKVTGSVSERMKILRYHLESSHSPKKSIKDTVLDASVQHTVKQPSTCNVISKGYFSLFGKHHKQCFIMDLRDKQGELVVIYSGSSKDWVHVCEDGSTCETSKSLSTRFRLVPTSNDGQIAVFGMRIEEIKKLGDFVRCSVDANSEERIFVKILQEDASTFSLNEPPLLTSSQMTISKGRIFSRVVLPFIRYPWLVYRMNITSQCKKPDAVTAIFHIPWFREDTNYTGTNLQDIPLKFYSEKPTGSKDAEIHLWYYTRCTLSIKIWVDLKATLGQLLKFNLDMIVKWVSTLSTISLLSESVKSHPSTLESHSLTTSAPSSVVTIITFLTLRLATELAVSGKTMFEVTVLFAFQLLAAAGILAFLCKIIWITLSLWRNIFKILTWIKRRIFGRNAADLKHPQIFILLELVMPLVALQFFSSSLGILIYLLLVGLKGATSDANVNHLLELGSIILFIRSPGLVVWIKEIKHSLKLDSDSFQSSAIVVLLVMFWFCNAKETNHSVALPKLCWLLVNVSAGFMTISSVPVYCLPWFICAAIFFKCILTKEVAIKSICVHAMPMLTVNSMGSFKKNS